MRKLLIWNFLLGLALSATYTSALSANISYVNDSTISIEGAIEEEDSKDFRELLLDDPERFLKTIKVEIDSPGGLMWEAQSMSELIADSALMVTIPEGGQCASACFLLLAAAPIRIPKGDVLIHRPYFSPEELANLDASEARALGTADSRRFSEAVRWLILGQSSSFIVRAFDGATHLLCPRLTSPWRSAPIARRSAPSPAHRGDLPG